jgi:cyclopropane fatty-acyl-phospholipid synthase-like methyltransferase
LNELPRYSPEQVRAYYDANTPAFEKLGQGGDAIRRAVWGPGVATRSQAFRYVDECILAELEGLRDGARPPRVLDLGCGVGASLLHLGAKSDCEGIGVTISKVQAARAERRLAEAGLGARLACLEASFTELPPDLGCFELAFAIEAFVHSPSPEAFFRAASAHLRPGARLLLCDDFLTARGVHPSRAREQRWLKDFRRGWMVSSLTTVEHAAGVAEREGLRLLRSDDLTPYLELRRPRDKFLTVLLALGRRLPIPGYLWRSWIGGNGLQFGLASGLLAYRLAIFEKRA